MTFLKKNLHLFVLFSITLLGSYFRLEHIHQNAHWFGDPGRDILVAKHLSLYKENLMIAPDAFGGLGLLRNSPLYYWLLSIIYFFFRSPESIQLFFAIAGISIVPLSYFLFREIANKFSSLAFSFFIAISADFIYFSRNIWQPHLLIPFQIISIIFFIKGLKKSYYYYWSLLFAFIATHIHFSYIFLLLTTIILITFSLLNQKKHKHFAYSYILILINIIIWTLLTRNFLNKSTSVLAIFQRIFINGNAKEFTQNVLSNFQILQDGSLFLTQIETPLVIIFLMMITSFFLLYVKLSKQSKQIYQMTVAMLISIIFFGIYHTSVYFHYLYAYLFIFKMSIFVFFSNIKIAKYLFLIPLLLFSCNSLKKLSDYYVEEKISEMQINMMIAQAILKHSNNQIDNISIKTCLSQEHRCSNPESFNSSVWFFIEEILDKKLGTLSNLGNGNNYLPNNYYFNKQDWYIVCQYSRDICLNDLQINISKTKEIFAIDKITVSHYSKD